MSNVSFRMNIWFSVQVQHLLTLNINFRCKSLPQKYSCPRCNIEYCSVGCYQSPGHQKCSEEFYKGCVLEEMTFQSKSKNPPKQSENVKEMYEMLRRVENDPPITGDFDLSDQELDSDDEDDYENLTENDEDDDDLAKRIEGIDLNDADAIWSLLNEHERDEFNTILQSEDVTSILPKFDAWWEKKIKRKLVAEMNGDETGEPDQTIDHPKIIDSIKDFGLISTKPPAPCVINNLINVLAAYASMVRYFYGEPDTNKFEAVNYMLSICANLRTNANFDDSAVAIESIRQDAHNEGYAIDENDLRQIQKDVDCLMNGPVQDKQINTFVLVALSELHRLFSAVKADQKSMNGNGNDSADGTINLNSNASPSASKAALNNPSTPSNVQPKDSDQFSKLFSTQNTKECIKLKDVKLTPLIKKIEYYLAYSNKFL